MPSASCLAAYTAASIGPAKCGSDGTQSPEIRNSLPAEDPPSGSSPRSPQPAAWPIPPAAAFPPPCEATPAEDERRPGPPDHRRTWCTRLSSTATGPQKFCTLASSNIVALLLRAENIQ